MSDNKEALREQLRRWRNDPVLFVRKALNAQPTEQQIPILNSIAKPGSKNAVKAGHGVGKTGIEAWIGIWHTFLFQNSKTAATAPSSTQLKDVLMAEVAKWVENAHPWVKRQLKVTGMRMEVVGHEQTQFLTARTARADKPDALQGLHADSLLFLIDEAFGVADPVYEVAKGALSTPGARSLLCGNPTATSGYAFNAFHRNKHLFNTFTLSCLNSPLVSKEFVEEMRGEYGEDSDVYKVRVLGEFPSAAINQLIPRERAEKAANTVHGRNSYHYAPKIIGVDVAWEGDDRSAVYFRQGLASKKLGSWYKIDNMTLAGLINQWWSEYDADAVFIDVGWGTGVIDYLRSLCRKPIPVNFGGSSTSAEYHNKRTQMWGDLNKWLIEGGSIDKDEDLIDDLIGPMYSFLPNGKKVLERKKDMKKRGLKSPDLADALVLTFAETVRAKSETERVVSAVMGGPAQMLCKTEYDIFS
jgi:hypothetical protein